MQLENSHHGDAADDRHEQIVQPLRLGGLLEGDVNEAAHAAEELDERSGFGGQDNSR